MSAPIIEATMYRCTYDGSRIEDVSGAFVAATVTMDPENDQTWSLEATATWDGYNALSPYLDWLAPVLTVTWPDGTVRQGQLGLYLVTKSPATRGETSTSVRLRALDPLWLVARQRLREKVVWRGGSQKDRALRQVLDSVVLTRTPSDRRRFSVPNTGKTFRKDKEFPKHTNKLELANAIAHGMGCYSLWTTKRGVITTKRMGEARLRQREPVRTYTANLPPALAASGLPAPLGGVASEVVGTIAMTPAGDDLLNEILLINDDSELPAITGKARVRNPQNDRAALIEEGRIHTRRMHHHLIDDNATAGEVASALLDDLSAHDDAMTLTVLPDPVPEFVRETVNLFLYDASGGRIAHAHYAVHRVKYGFLPASGTMEMDVGRISDAEGALVDPVEDGAIWIR